MGAIESLIFGQLLSLPHICISQVSSLPPSEDTFVPIVLVLQNFHFHGTSAWALNGFNSKSSDYSDGRTEQSEERCS